MSFCGSYRPQDVQFLLKPLALRHFVTVGEKERQIQSGRRHYSEMLSPETLPSEPYLRVFRAACAANLQRMARDCLDLAAQIACRRDGAITLVSLARAGTPVGVVLKHLLAQRFSRTVSHYSVSVIRDRGIDQAALAHILDSGHAPESIVFIDGWTGKGVMSRELAHTVAAWNTRHGTRIDSGLHVLSDLAGTAACAASCDDYLIPSSILNATVSGLVSRSILNDMIGPGDFHGCVYYDQFAPHDQSREFADSLLAAALALGTHGVAANAIDAAGAETARRRAAELSRQFMADAQHRHGITDANLIKPGIGEATRVLLRRVPRLLMLRQAEGADVAHLLLLAREKQVPVQFDAGLPYSAVALIGSALDA
ncbi:MAG: cysteine protease StiP family protein [Pseudomonadota bacterium]